MRKSACYGCGKTFFCSSHLPAFRVLTTEKGDLEPEFLGGAVQPASCDTFVKCLKHKRRQTRHKYLGFECNYMQEHYKCMNLLVSLFPAPQAGPVVVAIAQEVIIRNEPFDGLPDQVDIDGSFLHAKPERKHLG